MNGEGRSVTVTKQDWRGVPLYSWVGEIVQREPGHVTLRAVWRGPGTVHITEGVTFEIGDLFYEHYYDRQPYGLWQVLTPDGRLKCWYCNISTPAIVQETSLYFRDLLLDVLLLPDGRTQILDRDDLERARVEGMGADLIALAERATEAVLALIAQRMPPFAL